MNNMNSLLRTMTAITCVLLLAAGPAQAGKPEGVGGGKPDKADKSDKGGKPDKGDKGGGSGRDARDDDHGGSGGHEYSAGGVSVGLHFSDDQRLRVREYYGQQIHSGHCPPGLAKKNNGCMPPGQAKKWNVGRPLPPDVIFHDLEPEIVIRLGIPPPDHRFVRVASDILLIAVGTGMVLDAIEDLSSL